MQIVYPTNTTIIVAQAYGVDVYGDQQYSCAPADTACISGVPSVAPPNTGLFGMPQDAAIATIGGAVLLAAALVGIVFVIVSRVRAAKKVRQG